MQLAKLAILINMVLLHSRIYLEAQNFSEFSNYLLNLIYKFIVKANPVGSYIKNTRKRLLH